MKSNYKSIGLYIRKVDERNKDLSVNKLLGLSMTKEFRETTSNTIGTDMSIYKVMRKYQFACDFMSPIRVSKLPVVLKLDDEPNLVSPAYPVFEVKDHNELDPEYLMMWFRRTEFDRFVTFKCDAAIRGGYDWKELCETNIPVPHITKQREIVREYNAIENRIILNQKLIQKLEETAQAIYKHWFVEFEFPDENGNPYKSSGGVMIWNEELGKEIPKLWQFGKIGDLVDVINGYAFSSEDFANYGDFPIIKIANIVSPKIDLTEIEYYSGKIDAKLKNCVVNKNDVLISMTGSHMNQINSAVGKIGRYNYDFSALLNQRVGKLRPKLKCNEFVFLTMLQSVIQKEILMAATGSANQANISPSTIKDVELIIPNEIILDLFENIGGEISKYGTSLINENQKLSELKDLLLSKLSTVE